MNIGLKVKILELGKPQLWLARMVGISESRLSKIVGGWVEASPAEQRDLGRLLGCKVEDIFPSNGDQKNEARGEHV